MKDTVVIPGSAGRSGVSDLCKCLYGHGEGAGVISAVGTALPLGILSGVMAGWESDPCVITRGYLCMYSDMLRFLGTRKSGIRVAPVFLGRWRSTKHITLQDVNLE